MDAMKKMLELAKATNTAPVYEAFKTLSPVSAAVVDAYEIKLPDGYVFVKDFPRNWYVYQVTE